MSQTKKTYDNALKGKFDEYKRKYIEIDDLDKTKQIYELFLNNKMISENNYINDSMLMNYIGIYYDEQKDYVNMMKYYLMAIEENGNSDAMNNLGSYYCEQKDYENMKKYYLMAIENGNDMTMNNLADYYKQQKDYKNMKKYYLMAIEEHGNSDAMNNLGYYYYEQKDYENMKKYYLMAIQRINNTAMFNLGTYYKEQEEDYEIMEKYYLMALNNNYIDEIIYTSLLKYYLSFNFVDKYIDFINKYIDHIKCKNEIIKILSDDIRSMFYIVYIRNKRSEQVAYNNDCPICLNSVITNTTILKCKHQMCLHCLQKILSNKIYDCPICRTQIS